VSRIGIDDRFKPARRLASLSSRSFIASADRFQSRGTRGALLEFALAATIAAAIGATRPATQLRLIVINPPLNWD